MRQPSKFSQFITVLFASLVFTLGAAQMGASVAAESKGFSTPKSFGAGINVTPSANVEDTGLPLYPDATVERTKRDNEDGVNLNMWFGSYGFKLVVLKLKSADSAEKVEAFYRAALDQYGEVLDCTSKLKEGKLKFSSNGEEKSSKLLTCSDTKLKQPRRHDGKFYKAGTRSKQYGVAIQSEGDGSTFQLLHLETRGGDD